MPLFEYSCSDCNQTFEILVRSSSSNGEAALCPSCGGDHTTKLFSTFAAHMGSGARKSEPAPCFEGGCGAPSCGMGECGLN